MKDKIRIGVTKGLGDAIFMTPAIRAIRRMKPESRIIIYYTRDYHRDVFINNPNVDSIRRMGMGDNVINRCLAKGIRFSNYGRFYPNSCYDITAAQMIAEELGVRLEGGKTELFLSPDESREGKARVAALSRPLIGIQTTAAWSANKNWPVERWAELVNQNKRATFVQVGLKNDHPAPGTMDFRGIGLRRTFAVIGACDAFVGVDSGLAHAACALNVVSLVVCGPTSPTVISDPRSRILYSARPCSPCIEVLVGDRCPYGLACMQDITANRVSSELREMLGSNCAD